MGHSSERTTHHKSARFDRGNVQAERDEFRAQCASCHGYDGRGFTTVGRNLYPRTPNLAAAPTQALSDGALHYIIENGVPWTGMASWSTAHHAADAWKLVLFIRSLDSRGGPQTLAADTQGPSASAHYGLCPGNDRA